VEEFGGAEELWQRYDFTQHNDRPTANRTAGGVALPVHINVTLWAVNKTRTRITESWWLRFNPRFDTHAGGGGHSPQSMRLNKLASLIDPADVLLNGSKVLHALTGGVVYGETLGDPSLLHISSIDVPVVKVGAGNASLAADTPPLAGLNPAPLPNDVAPRVQDGFAFNIFNNLWSTNAIQWFPFDAEDRSWKMRFAMSVP
jgi:hypothetical protein